MIEQRRADRPVPAEPRIMGKPGLKEIGVQRRGDGSGTIQLLLVPTAVGKEELVVNPPILIDAERHCGVTLRIDGLEDKVVFQRISGIWIRMDGQKRKHVQRDRAEICDFVARKRNAATDETRRAGCGVWIKDLADVHWRVIARVENR